MTSLYQPSCRSMPLSKSAKVLPLLLRVVTSLETLKRGLNFPINLAVWGRKVVKINKYKIMWRDDGCNWSHLNEHPIAVPIRTIQEHSIIMEAITTHWRGVPFIPVNGYSGSFLASSVGADGIYFLPLMPWTSTAALATIKNFWREVMTRCNLVLFVSNKRPLCPL